MVSDQPELRVIREALDAVLAPTVASSILYEAIAAHDGEPPSSPELALQFVRGSLRHALELRVGSDADETIENLERMFARTAPRPSPRDLEITRELITVATPVVVFVLSAEPLLASALQSSLGAAKVAAFHISEVDGLLDSPPLGPPQIVLVDGADFPAIEPDLLAQELTRLPEGTVKAIWGADLPYGASVLQHLLRDETAATPIDRREGIDPVVDLIRSRQRERHVGHP